METELKNTTNYMQPSFVDRVKIIIYELLGKHELILKVIKKYEINIDQ